MILVSTPNLTLGRDAVTLTLVDGGAGDDDRLVNTTIKDPSGLGYERSVDDGGGGAARWRRWLFCHNNRHESIALFFMAWSI